MLKTQLTIRMKKNNIKKLWSMIKNFIYKNRALILKYLVFLIIGSIFFFIYFSFLTIVTSDSTNYYHYLEIFKGERSIDSWSTVRGPTFPFIIYIITLIFGDNSTGFVWGTFVFFLWNTFLSYFLINKFLFTVKNKHFKLFIWILFVAVLIFNPLIIGYYHVMLTEFVAISFLLISCLLSFSLVKRFNNKKWVILHTLTFCILAILAWFLKQPYVVTVLIPFILGIAILFLRKNSISQVITKGLMILVVFLSIFFAIIGWDRLLIKNGADSANTRTEGYLTVGLIRAVSNFRKIDYEKSHDKEFQVNNKLLSPSEINLISKIENGEVKYKDYDFYEVQKTFEKKAFEIIVIPDFDEGKISSRDLFVFFKFSLLNYPKEVLSSYILNYLSLINFIPYDYQTLYPEKRFLKLDELHGEIESIGFSTYTLESTFKGSANKRIEYMPQYKLDNPSTLSFSGNKSLIRDLSLISLTFALFVTPFVFFALVIFYLINRRRMDERFNKLTEIEIIIFGSSFFHILFHAITGATVDRYSFVAYPVVLLGFILLIILMYRIKKQRLARKFF